VRGRGGGCGVVLGGEERDDAGLVDGLDLLGCEGREGGGDVDHLEKKGKEKAKAKAKRKDESINRGGEKVLQERE
jgi:hypothetical protein